METTVSKQAVLPAHQPRGAKRPLWLLCLCLIASCGRFGFDPVQLAIVQRDGSSDATIIVDPVDAAVGAPADSDGDGVNDADEGIIDLDGDGIVNKLDADDDGDGIKTRDELTQESQLTARGDLDGDGQPAYRDLDSDGDGFSDRDEGITDLDSDSVPNFLDIDADGDGAPDAQDPTTYCGDGLRNLTETDIDCGGGVCAACGAGKLCGGASDCQTAACQGNRCVALSCTNGTKDGLETDVDCGGGCSGCGYGLMCIGATDCISNVCGGSSCGCSAGMADCTAAAGCETNIASSPSNCGGCGVVVSSAGACIGGVPTCNSGFAGNGLVCNDADECALNTDNCSPNATCVNTSGAFSCTCNGGFAGNGVTCTDTDECAVNTDNCDVHATCANTPGSFSCTCNSGYAGDGVTCMQNGLTTAGIATGGATTCGWKADGSLKCWGNDDYGNCADGDAANGADWSPTPVYGLGVGTTKAATAGPNSTCALTVTGGVKCWGLNQFGEVGNGSTLHGGILYPTDVIGLSGVATAINSASAAHCARITDGTVQCWGSRTNGLTGTGSTTPVAQTSAVTVPGLNNIVALSQSGSANGFCAVQNNGAVYCWGANGYGQVGDGTTMLRTTPTPVLGLGYPGVAVTMGVDHSCAVIDDTGTGRVRCWGRNNLGQLGNGTTTDSLSPVDVIGLGAGVITVAAGSGFTCALLVNGGVKCWGDNSVGQLGIGTVGGTSSSPASVTGLTSGVDVLAVGYQYVCATLTTGAPKCWGSNNRFQLGDTTTTTRPSAVDPVGF